MYPNNAVRTIEDVALKLKRIESQAQLYQKELQRLIDSKAEGSIMVINRWEKEINGLIKQLNEVQDKKMEIVKTMNEFVSMKFKEELSEQKENDWKHTHPLLKRSGKDNGAVDM